MADLAIGDTVRLKSGGPLMTIEEIGDYSGNGPNADARCVWFDGKHRDQHVFPIVVLKKDDNSGSFAIGTITRG